MAVETLRPNSSGTYTQIYHQKPNSGQHWDKVDEAVHDGLGTYVYSKTNLPPIPPDIDIQG